MRKLAGLCMIIMGLSTAFTGVDEELFLLGIVGIGISVAGLLITWKSENGS